MQSEVQFAGFGGQGIMLMGKILAHSAMEEGYEVSWVPSYGPEMRGGTAYCTVVISDQPIGSPVIKNPTHLVAMNRPSLEKFAPRVKKGGLLVVNSTLIPAEEVTFKGIEILMVPSRELALEAGNERLANMVVLGAVVRKSGVISLKSLKKGLPQALDLRYHNMLKMNIKALEIGARFAEDDSR